MGGVGRPKHGTKGKNRFFKRTVMDPKNRGRDLDRIQDDMRRLAEGKGLPEGVIDEDHPGGGLNYCATCGRHFITAGTLSLHLKTKDHRKQLRRVEEPQYTHAEALAGAGVSSESKGATIT
jgi:bud site selection protein 20